MFGYVRPCKDELRVKEYNAYRAMYCGLCHSLSKRYGLIARFIINYDFSFLALTLSAATCDNCKVCKRRCIASPFRKKAYYDENVAIAFSADANVILTYFKCIDGIKDEGFWKSLLYRIIALCLYPAYKKARKLRPEFDRACREGLDALKRFEEDNTDSIDAPADAFARIVEATGNFPEDEKTRRPLKVLFYHIGRWIYIVDAWDDMDDDIKNKNYNPIVLSYASDGKIDKDAIRDVIAVTLENSCATAASAAELLDFQENGEIIKNVLYLGLPQTANTVLNGKLNKRSKFDGSL